MTQRQTFFAAAAILLALFAIFLLLPDQQAGLDDDEALALWIVRDDVSMNAAPGDALRALRSNISQMIDRVHIIQPITAPKLIHVFQTICGNVRSI